MLKLMKYEFRKTWATKLILLGITAAAEIVYLIGLYTGHQDTTGMAIFLLVMLAFGGVLVIGLESVITLHRDMNTKQSYMLFMTPNSSYKILGAKVLECSLSILVTGAFFFFLGALDITLLFAKEGQLSQLWNTIQDFLKSFTVNGHEITFDTVTMACVTLNLLAGWIGTVTMAYLAVAVSAALLNGKRFNGLVCFVLFLALSWLVSYVQHAVIPSTVSINSTMLLYSLFDLAFAAVMYVVTAQIMERKLSV